MTTVAELKWVSDISSGRLKGILPALETTHAIVEAMRVAAKHSHEDVVVVCFSGRGDKDCFEVARLMGEDIDE